MIGAECGGTNSPKRCRRRRSEKVYWDTGNMVLGLFSVSDQSFTIHHSEGTNINGLLEYDPQCERSSQDNFPCGVLYG